ncbi:hypothetical protein GYMLUDRAFT_261493 [Collybiopsis luxurians FD-317 M1]|uniref:Unplaced genomic scaffold GYMLUscaffold_27, whole genome shotgun sequence n=1 Tax=Collybiopsis luxurians FD-317 M1 TaxID=944289 RepID=A0A0D0CWN4_9AGAR|nr:hypothetical protein GYMLUDRAFT_261493 [Collybiopsis luxurians FD-317 M1]
MWLLVDDGDMNSSFVDNNWQTFFNWTGWMDNSFTNTQNPADLVVSFQGTSISFVGNTAPVGAPVWFFVAIDSNEPYNCTYPGAGPTEEYIQWYQTPTLTEGLHIIKMFGITVALDYTLVTPGMTTPLKGSTIVVDDTDQEIIYEGNGWNATTNEKMICFHGCASGFSLGNGTHKTRTVGDGLKFTFAGTSISAYGVFDWTATGSISLDFTLDNQTTTNSKGNQAFIFDFLTYQPSFDFLAAKPNFTSSPLETPSTTMSISLPSQSTLTAASSHHNSQHTGAIIGATAGGALAFSASLILLCWRRRINGMSETPHIDPFNLEAPIQPVSASVNSAMKGLKSYPWRLLKERNISGKAGPTSSASRYGGGQGTLLAADTGLRVMNEGHRTEVDHPTSEAPPDYSFIGTSVRELLGRTAPITK